jgi:hypothetical protein
MGKNLETVKNWSGPTIIAVLLNALLMYFVSVPEVEQPVVETPITTVIESPIDTPVPAIVDGPMVWVVTKNDTVVEAPGVVAAASELGVGTYELLGIPETGKLARVRIAISDGTSPIVAPPTVQPVVKPEEPKPVDPPSTPKVTAVTYVYEKDLKEITPQVLSAMNKLNREHGIIASLCEDDDTNGKNSVPAQYKIQVEAARKTGLPALIVMAGTTVHKVVSDPKTEAQVLESIK